MRRMAYSFTACGPFSAYRAAFSIILIGNQNADSVAAAGLMARSMQAAPIAQLWPP